LYYGQTVLQIQQFTNPIDWRKLFLFDVVSANWIGEFHSSDLAVLRVLLDVACLAMVDIGSCVSFGEGLVEKLENWKVSERDLLVQYQGVVELE